jgi:hypothetical protein
MNTSQASSPNAEFPLVVQVGFAGTRKIPAELDEEIRKQLATEITNLRHTLGLAPRHFLCGISQLAIGADTLFTLACQSAGIPQRIFLPQHRDEFLNAIGSIGPDFNEQQKLFALTLLKSSHIIQERVVSDAADRRDRFHDVNLEIVRVCDLVICLVAAESSGKSGGTHELIALGQKRQRPILELRVETVEGRPSLSSHWHGKEHFRLPTLPPPIDAGAIEPNDGAIPTNVTAYYGALKQLASDSANKQRKYFKRAAAVVIGAHLAATIIAVIALTQHGGLIPLLLVGELSLLAIGFGMHQYIHRTHAVETWALSRLIAEVARSVASIGKFHTYLEYLFALPFPQEIRPLLRTVSVLHLSSSRSDTTGAWEDQRNQYISTRLTDKAKNAQIPYHERVANTAGLWLRTAQWAFTVASFAAFTATLLKILVMCHCLPVGEGEVDHWASTLGAFAVVLPAIAVASLSLAGAFDLEARLNTSEELMAFLKYQESMLALATSPREYNRILLETESRLLGETVNWYARRSFLGVA